MSKIIVLMGAPGAGKGTQARLLQERLHMPQISTGDIFRSLNTAHTPLAEKVLSVMAKGQLVPDDLTIRLVRERTSQDDCRNGYILDGFPRTPAQATDLDKLAVEQEKQIVPVLIDVPEELLFKRMTGRRSCPVCGEIYNVYFKPPSSDNVCDFHPYAQLVQRADDNPDTVRARLDTFESTTRPLIEYYKAKGLLHTVDGAGEPETIFPAIERIVKDS